MLRRRKSKRFLAFLAGIAAGGIPSSLNYAIADVTSVWNAAGSGNWSAAANWSTNPNDPNNGTPAGTDYQAVINEPAAGPYTVTVDTNINVDGVSIDSANAVVNVPTATLTVGSLAVTSGLFQLNGGTLSGGTSGGVVTLNSPSEFTVSKGTLDNLTFAGSNLNFTQGQTINITNGLNLSGNTLNLQGTLSFLSPSQTIDNLVIDGTGTSQSTLNNGVGTQATLTLGPNAEVHGNVALFGTVIPADSSVINNGIIDADASGDTLSITLANFTNNGTAEATNGGTLLINVQNWTNSAGATISANASTLTLANVTGSGSWSNAGTISAVNGSTVNLEGNFSYAGLGSFNVSADSTVNFRGTLNNTGNTLTFANASPIWTMNQGTISGGSVNFGSNLYILHGTLNGVTIPPGGEIDLPASSSLMLTGSWNNQGTIDAGAFSQVVLNGTYTAGEIGTINSNPSGIVRISGTMDNTGNTLTLSNVAAPWILLGIINGGAVATGSNLNIIGGELNGVTIPAGGAISVASQGYLTLAGSWSNQGTINVAANSTLDLAGTFTTAGIGTINANANGTVTITGTLDNTGNTLTANNISTFWNISSGATIANGAVATGSNVNFINGTLSGVTIPSGGTVQMAAGGTLSLTGAWNNQGTVTLGTGANLSLTGVFAQLGNINGQGSNSLNFTGEVQNTGTLTLTPSMGTITLNNAGISGGAIAVTGNQTLNVGPTALLQNVTLQNFSPNTAVLTDLQIENTLAGTGQNLYITGVGAPTVEFLSQSSELSNLYIVKANTSGPLVNSIFAGESYSGAPAATLTIDSNAGITATAGKIYLEAADLTNSTIVNNGTVSANGPTGIIDMTFLPLFTNNGTLSASNGGTVFVDNATLVNNGLIQSNGGTLSLHVTNNSGGMIDAANQSQLNISAGSSFGYTTNYGNIIVDNSTGGLNGSGVLGYFTNNGTIEAINGSSLTAYYNWTNAAGATISDSASTVTLIGTWTNDGMISIDSAGSLIISGTAANAGPSATVLNNGAITQMSGTSSLGAVSGAGTITIGNNTGGSSAQMVVASLTQSSLTINPTGRVTINGGPANSLNTLTINLGGYGGVLDINGGRLAINFGTTPDPIAAIRADLISGYNKGGWNGPGIASSAENYPAIYSLGYADGNVDVGTAAGANQIVIQYTIAGDANLDGLVNFSDLLVVAQDYGRTGQDWAEGDFNYDGLVNFSDLLVVAQNYGKELSAGQLAQLPGSFAAQWQLAEAEVQAGQSGNVPEPASCSLLIAGSLLLMRRARSEKRYPPA